jgi:hypothetical protein
VTIGRGLVLLMLVTLLAVAGVPLRAEAQSTGKYEIGVFVGAVNLREALHEKPLALGLRFGYRVAKHLTVESEVNSCVQNPSGNFGQLLVVVGPRAGVTFGALTVAGKLRAGVIHFGGRAFRAWNNDVAMRPVINYGAVFELAASRRVSIRIDAGADIVPFGSTEIRGPLPPYRERFGTTHNREGSFGFVYRF